MNECASASVRPELSGIQVVILAEREACARLCETLGEAGPDKEDHFSDYLDGFAAGYEAAATQFAAAIRAHSASSGRILADATNKKDLP